jgi:hypothetical protein
MYANLFGQFWTENAEKGSNFYFKVSLSVFHESVSRAPKYSIGAVLNFSKICRDIRGGMFITGGIIDTGEQFIAVVVDTAEQFIVGINDTGDKTPATTFVPGVIDTGQK